MKNLRQFNFVNLPDEGMPVGDCLGDTCADPLSNHICDVEDTAECTANAVDECNWDYAACYNGATDICEKDYDSTGCNLSLIHI